MGQTLARFSTCFSSRQAGRACKRKRNTAAGIPPLSLTVSRQNNSTITEYNGTGVTSELIVSPTSVDKDESNCALYTADVVVCPTPDTDESSWAWLPAELVGCIAERLPIDDYYRFRAVCTSWASSLPVSGYLPTHEHFPWLMISQVPYSFVSFTGNRSYQFPSELSGTECLGVQDGWLVSLHGFFQCCLLNPITRSQIQLPPFSPNVHIRKVVLSSSAPSAAAGRNFIVVAIYGLLYYRLAFTKPGNTSWTPLSVFDGLDIGVEDVVYHDGWFFCISALGQVEALDLNGRSPRISSLPNSYIGAVARSATYTGYLVSSFGDLLHVWKHRDAQTKITTSFTILKFNPNIRTCWYEIKDLGTRSLFLDGKHSMSFSADKVKGLKANCIYFTNERHVTDIGVFDIKKGKIEPWFPVNKLTLDCWLQPIWFMPSLS